MSLNGENDQGQLNENGNVPLSPPHDARGDESIDDGFQNMMRNLNGEEGEISDDDPEILKALQDVEEVEDYGPAITAHVAEAFSKTTQRPLSKDTYENLKKKIKTPENCKAFQVPKVNPEIWQHMRTRARVADIKSQQIQAGYSVALITLATMSHEIAQSSKLIPKELVAKLLKLGMDGANLIGNQLQDITKRRKMDIKPALSPEYAGICSDKTIAGEYLFGDNIMETLKTSKTTSGVMRTIGIQSPRFRPYPTQRSSPLNFQRPSSFSRGRWNGQQYHQQQNHQQSYRPNYNGRAAQNNSIRPQGHQASQSSYPMKNRFQRQ